MRAAAVATVLAMIAGSARADSGSLDVAAVSIDRAPGDDAQVIVDGDDVWVPAQLLCSHRICRDGTRVHEGVRYVSLVSLRPDVTYTYDREQGELVVTSAPAARQLTVIDLSIHAPKGIERTTSPSLFVNYAVHGDMDDAGTREGAAAEAGFSVGNALLYTAAVVTGATAVRGLSYASYDVEGSMVRVVAGDDVATSGALGSTAVVGGLHVRRDFAIDPYFVSRPTLSHLGVVTAPSTIEVYRGGQLVRRETLAPGPFRVDDVTGAAGTDAQIVVKDAYGASRATVSTLIAPPLGLLAPGLHAFDYSVGVVRLNFGTHSFDYGDAAFYGTHRMGVTPWLTVGARTEASLRVGNAGASATAQFGRFVVEGGAAASMTMDHDGAALSLHGSWQQRAFSFSAIGRVVGDHYATLDLDAAADRAVHDIELSTSWSYGNAATLMATGAYGHQRDGGDRYRGGLGANLHVWGSASLLLAASATRTLDGDHAYEGTATLVTALSSSMAGSVRAGYEAGHRMGAITAARSVPSGGGIGGQINAQYGAVSSVGGRVTAEHSMGRVDADIMWTPSSWQGGLAVAGGLVFIGGRMFATRPVQSGYVLVRAEGASGSRVYRENQSAGRLDSHGDLIVTDLQPFYANHIRLDARELPVDISLTDLERLVAPQRRGGMIVHFVSGVGAVVHGRIEIPNTDASYGEIVVDTLRGPLGRDGVFELEPVPAGHHAGSVELDGHTCTFTIDVPAGVNDVDLGAVRCTEAR